MLQENKVHIREAFYVLNILGPDCKLTVIFMVISI